VPARKGSTVRVRLARPEPEDAAELLALHRASRSFHRGRVSPPLTAAQFHRYLARCERPDFVGLLIRRRSDDVILGAVELSQIARGGFQSAYLGYHLGAPFAGQGYMTEALRLTMRHAFRVLKLHRMEANIQPSNRASIVLVKRLGFRREGYSRRYLKVAGRWRDHERWAILKEDWAGVRKALQ
jgi:ribosomal-protein-alanine N-acetyltransferase